MKNVKYLLAILNLSIFILMTENGSAKAIRNQPDSTQYTTVYLYRPENFFGIFVGFTLKQDKKKIGKLRNNSVHVVKIYQPSDVIFSARTFEKESKVPLTIEMNKTYYLKCTIRLGFIIGHPKLRLVDTSVGRKECLAIINEE
jgi:hypothetical protein